MRITVASGKGGTGKTTVAVNLALTAVRAGRPVHLCDCDVEEPNAHLFLDIQPTSRRTVTVPVPVVDRTLCRHCGECAGICEFNAIACLADQTLVFDDLCHSCGGCWLVCPHGAIVPEERPVGVVSTGVHGNLVFTQGRLQVGNMRVPELIEAVKKVPDGASWIIQDAPPGTTCPVTATLGGADFVLLVTEPTPFGLHDLELALALVTRMGIPCGVVLNRAEPVSALVEEFCARKDVPLLARIPFKREVAMRCAEGGLAMEADAEVAAVFEGLFKNLEALEVTS